MSIAWRLVDARPHGLRLDARQVREWAELYGASEDEIRTAIDGQLDYKLIYIYCELPGLHPCRHDGIEVWLFADDPWQEGTMNDGEEVTA
jgi:hypothetical protein